MSVVGFELHNGDAVCRDPACVDKRPYRNLPMARIVPKLAGVGKYCAVCEKELTRSQEVLLNG